MQEKEQCIEISGEVYKEIYEVMKDVLPMQSYDLIIVAKDQGTKGVIDWWLLDGCHAMHANEVCSDSEKVQKVAKKVLHRLIEERNKLDACFQWKGITLTRTRTGMFLAKYEY